jgi:ligand-binding sensor domain-containing protein
MKYTQHYALLLVLIYYTSCKQSQTEGTKIIINSKNRSVNTSQGPKVITRNIIQDRKGNIWMAAFDGVFKYDGKYFTDITGKVSSARFFSILEDSKGNFWFGSVGSGVYYYNGKSFRLFTTSDGLLDNGAGSIYEDSKGHIWFGGSGGASRYDGISFHHYILNGNAMYEDLTGKALPKKQLYGIGPIMEDKKGGYWFGTNGIFRYDGRTFTPFNHNGKPFKNVRSIIEDKKGNIWIGGADGLWRYNGSTFTNFMQGFVGHIMEDKEGNIWTSSGKNSYRGWALSRYEGNSLNNKNPIVTTIANKPMTFGILEDDKGNIWFGDFDGVHRYDGKTITDFNSKGAGNKMNRWF